MSRPSSLEKIPLVPNIVIDPGSYQAGFKGIVDDKGRMSIGKEYAGSEFYVFVKKNEV